MSVCRGAAALLQVGRGQKLGDGPGAMEFGDMTVEGLLQVHLIVHACCACTSLALCVLQPCCLLSCIIM